MNSQVPQQQPSPPPYQKTVDGSMSNSANDASGFPALQSALASGPAHPPPPQNIHHVQMMQQQQMVQSGQQNNNDLRRLVPRAPGQHPVSMVLAYQNHQRIQVQPVNIVPQRHFVVNGRGMTMAPVAFGPPHFQLPPGVRPVITGQQLQQLNNHHHQLQLQQMPPQQMMRNHPGLPPPQPQRNGHGPTLTQNGNAEVITLNESSASPDSPADVVSNGDASDMPILDRQDAQSTTSGGSSESSDHQTDTSRGIFVRESEEYNEMSKGSVLPHILTNNVCIMESNEPFATTAPPSSVEGDDEEPISHTEPEDFEAPYEKKRKAPQRTWTRGRGRGRPRGGRGGRRSNLSREGDAPKQEKEPDTRTPSPEENTPGDKKKRKRKRGEAERLLAMDFGPLAGERIMPENRRNRVSGTHVLMDMDDSPAASPPPPRRKRGRRRHSADSDIPDEMPTEESTEEDDDETEASEFELKTPKRMNYRRPQWCNDACRSTSIERSIKRGRGRRRAANSESEKSNSPADSAANEDQPAAEDNPGQVEFEVVGEETLAVPTEGQKQSRKTTGKEGEGADKRDDPPIRRRLRHSSSSYTAESLPGCSGSKSTRKPSVQSSPKPETVKSPKPPGRPPGTVKKEEGEAAPKKVKEESPMVVPKKEDAAPAPISRTPSSRLDTLNMPQGNPETWDIDTTVDYAAKEFGSEISQVCLKYELDGYVLFHGGDALERMRKAHFKLDNGKGVPFGPWKKMTSTMQTLKDLASKEPNPSNLATEHGLTVSSTTDHVYKWLERVTTPATAKLLRSAEFSCFSLLGITIDDLIKHTAINYGPALKIFLIVCKAAEAMKWPAAGAEDIATKFEKGLKTPAEFEKWLWIFLPKEYASKMIQAQIDMNLMYFVTTEEYLDPLGFPLGVAKSIEVAMKIVREKCDGKPDEGLKNVRGKDLASFLSPNSEYFHDLLHEIGGTPLERKKAQSSGLDGTLAFIVDLKELTDELHLSFGSAKKLILKLETIKTMDGYRESEFTSLPEGFAQNYSGMTVEDVAKWASSFCLKDDVSAMSAAGIDGRTLPFLDQDNMRKVLKLSFGAAKKIAMKLKDLPPLEIKLPNNFECLEGKKMDEWIERTADAETKTLLENAAMRGSYFSFITLEDLLTLGVKFGPAVRIVSQTQDQPKPASKMTAVPEDSLSKWTVDDVYKWVSSITTAEVAEQLRNNQIEGEMLQTVTFEELIHEVEIPFGPAKAISAMVKRFDNEAQ